MNVASPDHSGLTVRPTREEFVALAREHTVVPVWVEVLADLETPVAAFAKLVGPDDDGFLLVERLVERHGDRRRCRIPPIVRQFKIVGFPNSIFQPIRRIIRE